MISWPLATLPTGSESGKWLECNGQVINSSLYPKLSALMSNVPDFQGVFLRGYGSQYSNHFGTVLHSSSSLGALQGDSIRNITGRLPDRNYNWWEGAFTADLSTTTQNGGTVEAGGHFGIFDVSRVTPVTNEIRPVNKAVRYLIKAK